MKKDFERGECWTWVCTFAWKFLLVWVPDRVFALIILSSIYILGINFSFFFLFLASFLNFSNSTGGSERLMKNYEGRNVCFQCTRSYKNIRHLNRHLRYECGVEKQFKCPFCARLFTHRGHLKNHCIRLHNKFLSWNKILLLIVSCERKSSNVSYKIFLKI